MAVIGCADARCETGRRKAVGLGVGRGIGAAVAVGWVAVGFESCCVDCVVLVCWVLRLLVASGCLPGSAASTGNGGNCRKLCCTSGTSRLSKGRELLLPSHLLLHLLLQLEG